MSTMTDQPREVVELDFVRRQLSGLAWQRSTVGFSLQEEGEYRRLVTREEELLELVSTIG
jgi:hypothetical protein